MVFVYTPTGLFVVYFFQGMEEMGNERAKAHFEAEVPASYTVPREHATVREREKWIRDKYEHRRFVSRDPQPARQRKPEESTGSRSSRCERKKEGGTRSWIEKKQAGPIRWFGFSPSPLACHVHGYQMRLPRQGPAVLTA